MAAFGGLFGLLREVGGVVGQISTVARSYNSFGNMFGWGALDANGLDRGSQAVLGCISLLDEVRKLTGLFSRLVGAGGIFGAAEQQPKFDVGSILRSSAGSTEQMLAKADREAPIALTPVWGAVGNTETVTSAVPLSKYFERAAVLQRAAPNIALNYR